MQPATAAASHRCSWHRFAACTGIGCFPVYSRGTGTSLRVGPRPQTSPSSAAPCLDCTQVATRSPRVGGTLQTSVRRVVREAVQLEASCSMSSCFAARRHSRAVVQRSSHGHVLYREGPWPCTCSPRLGARTTTSDVDPLIEAVPLVIQSDCLDTLLRDACYLALETVVLMSTHSQLSKLTAVVPWLNKIPGWRRIPGLSSLASPPPHNRNTNILQHL